MEQTKRFFFVFLTNLVDFSVFVNVVYVLWIIFNILTPYWYVHLYFAFQCMRTLYVKNPESCGSFAMIQAKLGHCKFFHFFNVILRLESRLLFYVCSLDHWNILADKTSRFNLQRTQSGREAPTLRT